MFYFKYNNVLMSEKLKEKLFVLNIFTFYLERFIDHVLRLFATYQHIDNYLRLQNHSELFLNIMYID